MEENSTPPPAIPVEATSNEDKTVAIVAYLSLLGFIIALIIHGNKKTTLGAYHLRQMLGIIIFAIPCIIPILGWIWAIFIFIAWIIGLVNAIGGKMKPVPLIGPLAEKWFANTFN